ncbi:MAG: mechanosensitive ion channel [Alphaproteobacteria bacterium]|nr:mechanosensitive ion channel [Alphaproteobacteria bacterium]
MSPARAADAPNAPDPGGLADLLPTGDLQASAENILRWLNETVLTPEVAIQLALVLGAVIPAILFGGSLKTLVLDRLSRRVSAPLLKRAVAAFAVLSTAIVLYLTLTVFRLLVGSLDLPTDIIDAAISLMTAWILVRLVTLVIRSAFWSSVAFYLVWPIAVLDILGIMDDVIAQMRSLAIPLGENADGKAIDISLFDVVRTLIYFGLLFWAASTAGRLIEEQIQRIEELNPSVKALFAKLLRVALPVIALLVALQIVGFNLATLAVFSGAVGLGIGLGLQRTIGNFIAGFTLIADRSIAPGDVIEIDDTFGWVTAMEGRYVAIRTRDGTEHLVPNERFMSEGVVNWSRSDRVIRLHAPFGIAYGTRDLKKVQDIATDAARSVARVVESPSPVCNVTAFGDSAVEFDLRFWIADPKNGMGNVRSEVYLALWEGLHENGIEIPFPQRDLHVKSWPAEPKGARPAP